MCKLNLEYYQSLDYPIVLKWVEAEHCFSASSPLLPGLTVYADTKCDALVNLADAKKEWLATAIKRRIPIPEP
jgi:predicted RNase H-like HicB family nuclease